MLSNFQLEDHALLQSFLVGQPEFRDMMQGAEMQQLRQRVIASYHLGPLDAEETRAYIEHRLSHVGWEGDPIFSPAAFTTVYGHSGGIPRRINTLCDRLMLAAFLAERHSIDEDDVRAVIEELNEEFAARGGKVEARPILRDAVGGAGAGPGVSEIRFDQLALDRLKVSPEVAEQVAGMAANFDVQRIEARLAGLEHSMSATLGVLNQLLQAVRRDGPVEEESQ